MNQKNTTAEHWDSVIKSKHSLFDINLKELWHYRDLLVLFAETSYFVSGFKFFSQRKTMFQDV
jgi:lipopolysaccharide transport system permease protein